MATNLFVARTPLQLFNCIEARDRFHSGEDNRLLLGIRKGADRGLMEEQLEPGWAQVRRVALQGLGQHLYPWRLSSWLQDLGPLERCYLGLPRHLGAHVVNRTRPRLVVLVDDGNETLKIVGDLLRGAYVSEYRTPLRHRLLGKDTGLGFLEQAQFFTVYGPSLPLPADRILANDYRCFRHRIQALPETDEVWIIGSRLVGTYLKDQEALLAALERLQAWYGDRRLVYVSHRYESARDRTAIQDRLGLELRSFPCILERAVLREGRRPREVASLRSTALDTLARLYGVPARVFAVSREQVRTEAAWQELRALYAHYQRSRIPVVSHD